MHSGLAAIVVSLLLSWIAGIPGKFLLDSFNSSLFLMLFGVIYLFSTAQENRTLELVAQKTFALCRGNKRLLPVVLFLLSALISAIGPGLISVSALVSVLIITLAKEMDAPAIRLIPFDLLGAFADGLSPITPTDIVAIIVFSEHGIMGVEKALP